jgi:GTP:adenosylcobinamide-phosphate guanylyltransferase
MNHINGGRAFRCDVVEKWFVNLIGIGMIVRGDVFESREKN